MKKLTLFLLAFLLTIAEPLYAQQGIPIASGNNTITADDDYVEFIMPVGVNVVTINLTGTFVSTNRIDVTPFDNGWAANTFVSGITVNNASDGSTATTQTAVGSFVLINSGWQRFRVYGTNWTSGTVTVSVIRGYGIGGGAAAAGGGDASAANQTTAIGHLSEIEIAVETLADTGINVLALPAITGTVGLTFNGSTATFAAPVPICNSDLSAACLTPLTDCTWDSQLQTSGAVLEREVKGTAGRVYHFQAYSLDDTDVWVKFYNLTAANADETDTPVARIMIPANATPANGGGNNFSTDIGAVFSTAITYRVTKAIADNDTTALDANEVVVNVCYK